jgi:hypothetical protein
MNDTTEKGGQAAVGERPREWESVAILRHRITFSQDAWHGSWAATCDCGFKSASYATRELAEGVADDHWRRSRILADAVVSVASQET